MNSIGSQWMHRLMGGVVILGIATVAYADHCWDIQMSQDDCGTDQQVYGLDCSHWRTELGHDPVFVSCPNQLLYTIEAADVNVCLGEQPTGYTDCFDSGEEVQAMRQYYKCFSNQSCTVIPDGAAVPDGDPCPSATTSGVVCGH